MYIDSSMQHNRDTGSGWHRREDSGATDWMWS